MSQAASRQVDKAIRNRLRGDLNSRDRPIAPLLGSNFVFELNTAVNVRENESALLYMCNQPCFELQNLNIRRLRQAM